MFDSERFQSSFLKKFVCHIISSMYTSNWPLLDVVFHENTSNLIGKQFCLELGCLAHMNDFFLSTKKFLQKNAAIKMEKNNMKNYTNLCFICVSFKL